MALDEQIGKQIGDEIVSRRLEILEKAGATLKKIAQELASIAFARIDDFVTVSEGGEIQAVPLDKIPRKKLAAVKKIKEHTRITESSDGEKIYKDSHVEYELWDKLDALKYLVKLRGDEPAIKQEVTGRDGSPLIPAALQKIEIILRRPGDITDAG